MKEDIWRMDSTQSVEGLLIKVLRETKLTERFIDTSTRVKFYKFNNCELHHNSCLGKWGWFHILNHQWFIMLHRLI